MYGTSQLVKIYETDVRHNLANVTLWLTYVTFLVWLTFEKIWRTFTSDLLANVTDTHHIFGVTDLRLFGFLVLVSHDLEFLTGQMHMSCDIADTVCFNLQNVNQGKAAESWTAVALGWQSKLAILVSFEWTRLGRPVHHTGQTGDGPATWSVCPPVYNSIEDWKPGQGHDVTSVRFAWIIFWALKYNKHATIYLISCQQVTKRWLWQYAIESSLQIKR